MKVFENKYVFRPKKQEIKRGMEKITEELRNSLIYSSPSLKL
jgi:hypothetical protein